MLREESIFVTAVKLNRWPPPEAIRCASCGSAFKPDVVLEDFGGGQGDKAVGHWVSLTWSYPSSRFVAGGFCWGCASLFMNGNYRGASHDYEVDLEEFAATIQRVVRKRRHEAFNPQESDYPGLGVELIDDHLEEVRRLEAAHVVSRRTFDCECRTDFWGD